MSKLFIGYDPGGNQSHGVASIQESVAGKLSIQSATIATAEDVIGWLGKHADEAEGDPVALGVDTLTAWSTSRSGYRPADRALRAKYAGVANSVVAPNSLYGSMPINGATVISILRSRWKNLKVTETHPKVVYFALTNRRYDFNGDPTMVTLLAGWLSPNLRSLPVSSEHEWDALISAFAAREWHSGTWQHDLHALSVSQNERLVWPVGPTSFAWPEAVPAYIEPKRSAVGPSRATAAAGRTTWRAAVDALHDAGHPDAARGIEGYENARGTHAGWDAWFKRVYADLMPIVFESE